MSTLTPPLAEAALRTVNHIPAMVAYWDADQRCVFSNDAYQDWFGRGRAEMTGITLRELLGPDLYGKNEPHIRAALAGEPQVFERRIPLPGGGFRDSIATYTPDIVAGEVRGFSVHVADVTQLRDRENRLEAALRERDAALAEAHTLRGLLPICAGCKHIRNAAGEWEPFEQYLEARTEANFTHGICPECQARLYPEA